MVKTHPVSYFYHFLNCESDSCYATIISYGLGLLRFSRKKIENTDQQLIIFVGTWHQIGQEDHFAHFSRLSAWKWLMIFVSSRLKGQ